MDAIIESLTIIGLLGGVLGIITLANVILGATYNVGVLKKPFEIGKFFFGFVKAVVIYIGVALLTIGASALPVVIELTGLEAMIKVGDLEILQAAEVFSVAAIALIILTVIITQGKGAVGNLLKLMDIGTETAIQKSYNVENETENN